MTVWGNAGDWATSDTAWFETGKRGEHWQAQWISPPFDKEIHPVMCHSFSLHGKVRQARAYVCGLGLYELYINGQKAGDEVLTPFCNDYDTWIQYQTIDITALLGEQNYLEAPLGNGWYKGDFGFFYSPKEIYGSKFAFLCELHIQYKDGSEEIIASDLSWTARKSRILRSGIFYGEFLDDTADVGAEEPVLPAGLGYERLCDRLSPPLRVMERRKPVAVLHTPAGETVLDMGQNFAGWMEMEVNAPIGHEIFLQFGEVLKDGNFYRENLTRAKAEYRYISGGTQKTVRPHFTFYGFRYVKITGWPGEVSPDSFTACVIHSDIPLTSTFESSDPLVNRLYQNALWSQKSNFLDVPTDCPQRCERLGWTGDAQIYSATACYYMDTYAFFHKYLVDLWCEQQKYKGRVPHVVPNLTKRGYYSEGGSSGWGEAATVIPWNLYLFYGDKTILEEQLPSMEAWVQYIRRIDDETGGKRLWTTGFHFGDWLALDGPIPGGTFGMTDCYFLASAFYYLSARLTAKASDVLAKPEKAAYYHKLAEEIRKAIQKEYFTETGRLAVPTQTGYIISLWMDLAPKQFRDRLILDFAERLHQDNDHLKTGFLGTPYLCLALSENGLENLAYTLFLNRDYPGWLYEVLAGATTIWERWDGLLPSGEINGDGMCSFNHYAYGSVMEWVFKHVAGLCPEEKEPGFRRVRIAPQPDARLKSVAFTYESASGPYAVAWRFVSEKRIELHLSIPFGASAQLFLKGATEAMQKNGTALSKAQWRDGGVWAELTAGSYDVWYER